jgi:23S rRNA (adenine2030-N6)-methyltransferase
VFSYRHGFHAGNHADVLKHVVLVQLLKYLAAKDKGFSFIDTHAGAGSYALGSDFAQKRQEFRTGIERLWTAKGALPAALADYLAQVAAVNRDGQLRFYPGSPQIALQMARPQDRLAFFELHSTEGEVLQAYFSGGDKRIKVHAADGFAGLKSQLPPPSRRGLVLVDPSYEDKADYAKTIQALQDALKRFTSGVYAVWYPMVRRGESQHMASELQHIAPGDWLHVSLKVAPPPEDGLGLFGSGMFVFNPPWNLEAALRECMPVLARLLDQQGYGSFTLNFKQT